MLELIARDEHQARTLERILRIIEAAVSRTAYLSMLVEGQEILARLVQLTARAPGSRPRSPATPSSWTSCSTAAAPSTCPRSRS